MESDSVYFFCIWFLSLNIVFQRFVHDLYLLVGFFLLLSSVPPREYSIIRLCLDCFQFEAMTDKAAKILYLCSRVVSLRGYLSSFR